jgi:3-oxoacyl-[acyl-carrier protein] reductase
MIDLLGRVALVTGGSRGIGWACAETLTRAGAQVAFTWHRDRNAALEAVRSLREQGGTCEAVRLELGDAGSAREAVSFIRERLGRIDILVNNAGEWNRVDSPLVTLPEPDLDRMLRVNLQGLIQVTREAVVDMIEDGWGRIISIGSSAGVRGEAGHSHYAAAKGALLAWSRSLAAELGHHGITANVVSPGWVYTDMTKEVLVPDMVQSLESSIPTRRLTRPDDVAGTVLFLASLLAAQITGVNIDVNGGAVFS